MMTTHYHQLVAEFDTTNKNICVYHMSMLEEEKAVVFLYKIAEGPCAKSHGFNAASAAGVPEEVRLLT